MILFAPRIGNDVLYVTYCTDDIDFVGQAQYLVRLEGVFSWQAQHFGAKMLYFTIQKRLQDGIGEVPEAAGAR